MMALDLPDITCQREVMAKAVKAPQAAAKAVKTPNRKQENESDRNISSGSTVGQEGKEEEERQEGQSCSGECGRAGRWGVSRQVQGPRLALSLKGQESPAGAGLVTRGAALWEGWGRAQPFIVTAQG